MWAMSKLMQWEKGTMHANPLQYMPRIPWHMLKQLELLEVKDIKIQSL